VSTGFTTLSEQYSGLLELRDFLRSEEFFNVSIAPANATDRMFCITVNNGRKNTTFNDKQGYFFPIIQFKVSFIFCLGNNKISLYNNAISLVEDALRLIIEPDNRPEGVRFVEYVTLTQRMFNDTGGWLLVDLLFDAELTLSNIVTFEENEENYLFDENDKSFQYDEGTL